MKISLQAEQPSDWTTLAILSGKGDTVDQAMEAGEGVSAAARLARFEGEAGSVVEHVFVKGGAARRILLVGIGDAQTASLEKAGAAISARLATSGETRVVIDARQMRGEEAASLALAARLRGWRYDRYKTRQKDPQKVSLTDIVVLNDQPGADKALERAKAVARGVEFTRTLVTEPANILYPESFVERCREAMADTGLEVDALDEAAMEALGMGALLGVGQGSVRDSRLLVLRWMGGGETGEPPLVLVGKGVCFDTGGISLKPGPGMEDMKWDMGGAGAVVGAMLALASRKAKANVVAVCGLVENMPDGNAQRPGDVVSSMSGQTIEVLNTDAEGRLVLADAITWAQREFSPKVIVDLATLTGAMIISLGHQYGGLFSNDDGLAAQLTAAGAGVGDNLWRFPLGDAYDKQIDSPIADMKNIGPREGGSITAAQFIKRFVDDGVKWAHLDIAGMVWSSKPGATWGEGATGFGVRLLDKFVADNFEG